MRIGVVFNPRSGVRHSAHVLRSLQGATARDGHNVTVHVVDRQLPLESALQEMIPELDAIAVIGGDGTLNGVANGVLLSKAPETPIAFFPAGRGKDVARSVPSFSLRGIGSRHLDWQATQKVDVIRAKSAGSEDRFVLNASDVGLISAATRFSIRMPRKIGSFAYVLGGVYGFAVTRATTASLSFDGCAPIELDGLLSLAVCNGRAFGGGLYIAPDARADDGLLDVVAIRNANLTDLLANLPKLKRGTLREHPALTRWQARSVRIDNTSLDPVDVDGELWGAAPLTYTIVPSALNWIGPSE